MTSHLLKFNLNEHFSGQINMYKITEYFHIFLFLPGYGNYITGTCFRIHN